MDKAPETKEMHALGALLAAMHDQGLDGEKALEAMRWFLRSDAPSDGEVVHGPASPAALKKIVEELNALSPERQLQELEFAGQSEWGLMLQSAFQEAPAQSEDGDSRQMFSPICPVCSGSGELWRSSDEFDSARSCHCCLGSGIVESAARKQEL